MTVAQEFVKVSMIAKDEVKKLINAENNPEIGLRLGVKGGGCSGFEYVWGQSDSAVHERIQWSKPVEGILLLDPMSEIYVMGSEIDYVEELGGSFLTIRNPMQTSSCGCGASFSV